MGSMYRAETEGNTAAPLILMPSVIIHFKYSIMLVAERRCKTDA